MLASMNTANRSQKSESTPVDGQPGNSAVRYPRAGVFAHLVDERAFVDRIRIGLDGMRRKRPPAQITVGDSFAIGGPDRPYARALNGLCPRTGNPFQVRYGANPGFPNLHGQILDLRSGELPLTLQDCKEVAGSLLRAGYRSQITYLELTCDLSGTSVAHLRDHFVARATYFRELRDSLGFMTVYIGSPKSPWQLKIYDKLNAIVRVEFALRPHSLRGLCVEEPDDVSELRSFDSAQFVRFCNLTSRPSKQSVAHIWKPWVKDLLVSWSPNRSLQTWARLMRGWKVDAAPYLANSEVQRRLRGMHRRFLW